jgi:hypothetical protein
MVFTNINPIVFCAVFQYDDESRINIPDNCASRYIPKVIRLHLRNELNPCPSGAYSPRLKKEKPPIEEASVITDARRAYWQKTDPTYGSITYWNASRNDTITLRSFV